MKKLVTLSFAALLVSCGGNSSKPETADVKTDTVQKEVQTQPTNDLADFQFHVLVINVPSPLEIITFLPKAGLPFNKSLVNATENETKYTTSTKKGLNYGAYIVDLVYLSTNEQFSEVKTYFKTSRNLAQSLGCAESFDNIAGSRLESNIDKKDTINKVIDQIYTEMDGYLRSNDRLLTATQILVGSWIESQYITVGLIKDQLKKVVTSYQKEQCLTFVQEVFPELSYAKACKLVSCSRTNKYYKKVMPGKDVVVKEAITSVIGTSRLGRRKVIVKVQKKHPGIGAAKIRRVYEKEGFSLYKRMKKRRADNPANPIEVPLSPNIEWAMDFMSDSLANGKKFRTLNIVDQYNRKCLEIGINFTLPSRKVIEILERTIDEYGKPLGIRTDNGPEFTSCLFQSWLDKNDIEWIKIQKGKPQQNAIVERFNRTYREDILDANLFFSLDHVYEVTQPWKEDYNQERPHESLNYCTPNEYAA